MAERSKKAITDLVVIVLGVLIALFAKNQWGAFRDGREAHEYLERLSAELVTNRALLDGDVAWVAAACAATEATLDGVREPDSEAEALLRLATSAAIHPKS